MENEPSRWRAVEQVLFAMGCMAIAFLAGMVVARARLFPYPELNAAQEAVNDWRENWRHYLGVRSRFALPSERTEGGVVKHDPSLAFDGYTLVSAYRPSSHEGFNATCSTWTARSSTSGTPMSNGSGPISTTSRLSPGTAALGYPRRPSVRQRRSSCSTSAALGTARLDRCSNVHWAIRAPDPSSCRASARWRRPDPLRPSTGPSAAAGPAVCRRSALSGYFMDDTILRLGAGRAARSRSIRSSTCSCSGGWASALICGPGAGQDVCRRRPAARQRRRAA